MTATELKALIDAQIVENSTGDITAAKLNNILKQLVDVQHTYTHRGIPVSANNTFANFEHWNKSICQMIENATEGIPYETMYSIIENPPQWQYSNEVDTTDTIGTLQSFLEWIFDENRSESATFPIATIFSVQGVTLFIALVPGFIRLAYDGQAVNIFLSYMNYCPISQNVHSGEVNYAIDYTDESSVEYYFVRFDNMQTRTKSEVEAMASHNQNAQKVLAFINRVEPLYTNIATDRISVGSTERFDFRTVDDRPLSVYPDGTHQGDVFIAGIGVIIFGYCTMLKQGSYIRLNISVIEGEIIHNIILDSYDGGVNFISVANEGLMSIDQEINRIDQSIEGINQSIEGIDQSIEGIDQSISDLGDRVTALEEGDLTPEP